MKPLDDLTNSVAIEPCASLVIETILQGMRTIRMEMRSHRPQGLTIPQFRALIYLHNHTGASLSNLAEHLGLTLPSVSKTIDNLVKRELVLRQTDAEDRRRMTLALTEKGRSALELAKGATHTNISKRLQELSDEERALVVSAMHLLKPVLNPIQDEKSGGSRI